MKMTAEARKHIITRTSISYRATVRTFNMKDGSQGELTATVSGDFASDMDMLAHIASRYTTADVAVVPVAVKPIEKVEDRRAMFDDDFVRYSTPVREGDKLAGLMVRTMKLYTVKAVCADFVSRTFTDEKVYVTGNFNTADEALAWYMKRNPDIRNHVYGMPEIDDPVEVKYGIPVSEFYAHSFSLNDEE